VLPWSGGNERPVKLATIKEGKVIYIPLAGKRRKTTKYINKAMQRE